MRVNDLQPQRHEPPAGWDATTFETLTDAIAAALVASYRREAAATEESPPGP